ncbi:unnamed protein product [Cylicocyclus nassatus]|uniref:Uncharacterized protein n=1 Tax=Cylicocyclus nassatus TaxID=53992 RepID=A0AA36HET1_CYLNA|nr:unnamed protein product [Cylicocyclus nassatus]
MIRPKCAPMRSPMAEKHRIPDHVTEKELLKDKKILRTGMILRRPVPNVKYTFTPPSESPSPPPVKKEKKYRYTSSSESSEPSSPLWAKKERKHLETSEKLAFKKHSFGEDQATRRRKKHRRSGVPPGALEDENFTFTSSGRLICAPGKHPNFSK